MKFQNNELTKLCITSVWGGEGRGGEGDNIFLPLEGGVMVWGIILDGCSHR
jgi:hypothetical protein